MAFELKSALDSRVRTAPEKPARDQFPRISQAGSDEALIPAPEAAPAHQPVTQKKARAKFALGGSCSSSERDSTVKLCKPNLVTPSERAKLQIDGCSESASTQSSIQPAADVAPRKKQPVIPTNHHAPLEAVSAIDSDSEDDYVNESVVDGDDDSSGWEDATDSSRSSVGYMFSQRVDPKADLATHPSLITFMLAQERQKNLSSETPHTTAAIIRSRARQRAPPMGASPNDSHQGLLMMKGLRPSKLRPDIEVPRSRAQPIIVPTKYGHAQAALSPRTTRRNMLATELTESLRRHLLWERQQKTSTANAVLRRRLTSHDVVNMRQFPEQVCLKRSEGADASSWNRDFSMGALDSYHSRGW